jgi:hypothetical protein
MSFSSWQRNWMRAATAARRRTQVSPRQPTGFRPRLEALDERWLPSGLPYPTAATVSQLIADINYADKTGGAFAINLKPGTTFDVKTVNNTTNGANGLPVIGGTKAVNLTIVGNGDTIERVGSKSFHVILLQAVKIVVVDQGRVDLSQEVPHLDTGASMHESQIEGRSGGQGRPPRWHEY